MLIRFALWKILCAYCVPVYSLHYCFVLILGCQDVTDSVVVFQDGEQCFKTVAQGVEK